MDLGWRIEGVFGGPPPHERGPAFEQPKNSEGRSQAKDGPDYFAIATLVVLAFQAWIFHRQTGLIDKQATVAHQAYIANHRAILRARRFRIALMQAGEPIKVEFETINMGATAADMTGRVVLVAILDAPGTIFGLPHLALQVTVKLPWKIEGGEVAGHHHVDDTPVHEDDVAAVNAGTRFLHVIGRVTYTDDNGRPRETGFFRCYDVGLRRFREVGNTDFEYED
jgi:hypothetical protein